jgi:small subunit ribosomal protein S8e
MTVWQGRSRRKFSGGRYRPLRKKRKHELGSDFIPATLGEPAFKPARTRGGHGKNRILAQNVANVLDPATGKTKKVKIVTVKESPANPNYVQRNIMTKGAKVQTEIGLARITSRPGQDGVLNAVLVKE